MELGYLVNRNNNEYSQVSVDDHSGSSLDSALQRASFRAVNLFCVSKSQRVHIS
jgi:hypothetical protein